MKKAKAPRRTKRRSEALKPEYRLDYAKARPNRFAASYAAGSRVIVLEPDLARVFTTAESVNAALRAILKAVPPRASRR